MKGGSGSSRDKPRWFSACLSDPDVTRRLNESRNGWTTHDALVTALTAWFAACFATPSICCGLLGVGRCNARPSWLNVRRGLSGLPCHERSCVYWKPKGAAAKRASPFCRAMKHHVPQGGPVMGGCGCGAKTPSSCESSSLVPERALKSISDAVRVGKLRLRAREDAEGAEGCIQAGARASRRSLTSRCRLRRPQCHLQHLRSAAVAVHAPALLAHDPAVAAVAPQAASCKARRGPAPVRQETPLP